MFPIRDHNPSSRVPVATWVLIGLNVAIYLYGLGAVSSNAAMNRFLFDYAMIPARISAGQNYSALVTSLFIHGGVMHLAGNMLFLWIFGDNMEDQLGAAGFVAFYLVCGVGADLGQYLVDPASRVPTIGASGAIAGVMGGYLLFFPRARVDVLIFLVVYIRLIPIPAWLVLGLWFGLQLFSGVGADPTGGGVAYWAHVTGFGLGLALMLPVWALRGGPAFWAQSHGEPPHPEAAGLTPSTVPVVRRRKNRR